MQAYEFISFGYFLKILKNKLLFGSLMDGLLMTAKILIVDDCSQN